jgi:putative ABC transport system permease protein
VPVAYVTANFFETYGVQAAMGRTFTEADDTPSAPDVAVLDRGFWKDRFGGDAAIVGKTLQLDTRTVTIVGVLPDFPWHREAKVYVPVSNGRISAMLNSRENHNASSVTGRLKRGVTLEQGYADLAAIEARLAKAYPGSNRDLGIHAVSLQEWVSGGSRRTILILFGAVAVLLMLACVNVANMMLARSVSRTREFSVRLALGASQSALVRQLLTECLLLGVGGALLGLLLSKLMLPALSSLVPASIAPRLDASNLAVFSFTALAGIASALIFGVAPAFAASRVDLHHSLKERSASGSGGHARLRGGLVIAQVSLALVLLAGAGLLLRSLARLLGEDPGFRTEQLLAMNVSLAGGGQDLARLAARFAAMEERIRVLPGIAQVASTSIAPMSNSNSNAQLVPEGFEIRPGVPIPSADYRATSQEYFDTMGIRILKGRVYSKADGVMPAVGLNEVLKWFATANYQVVVNEEMARRLWPGQDPLGRRFRFGPPSMKGALMTVCGVAADTRQRGLDHAPQPMFYMSSWMYPWDDQTFVIRTASDPAALTQALRRTLLAAEPSAVVAEPRTIDGIVREQTVSRRSNLYMMAAFAGLALLLAAIGIYGVVAYAASQRRREFALRIALGATSARVMRSVLGDASKLILAGVAVGLVAAIWLSKLIAGLLYGVKPADPWSYFGAAALLLVSGLAATLGPAWRAAAADPAESLRAD